MKPILEVQSLAVCYGPVMAVRRISFEVAEGEIVCILGANGAGKTSTLLGVLGAVQASGSILFQGVEMSRRSVAERTRSGFAIVPEGRQIVPTLTVRENLLLGAYHRSGPEVRQDLEAAFRTFPGLAPHRSRLASALSGGQQQMLAVARAMMARPRLLLMDEPTMGLAPKIVRDVFRIVEDIRDAGTSVLLVEQNARLALSIANRAYVLHRGAVALSGASRDLLRDPKVVEVYLG